MLQDTKLKRRQYRVSVRGVKSLVGHFVCLCRGFEFYEVKKKKFVIIFQKENGNTFTLFIIFIVKSLQKEQNSTNLLLWPPICRNKSAITRKWFNSLDTNSSCSRLKAALSNYHIANPRLIHKFSFIFSKYVVFHMNQKLNLKLLLSSRNSPLTCTVLPS